MKDISNSSRRKFLLNVAKVGAALPFAGHLLGQQAFAATSASYKNVLFMYMPNGVHPKYWNPVQGTGPIATTGELSFGLGALKEWHKNIIVLKNIYVDIEAGGGNKGAEGGGHTHAQAGCLTGDYNNDALPSIDNLIAEKLGNKGVLSVGVRTGNGSAEGLSLMVSKPRGFGNSNRPIPNNNPADVAAKLAARVAPVAADPLQSKVYAAAAADMAALPVSGLGADRTSKITQHQAALAKLKDSKQEGTGTFSFNDKVNETFSLTDSLASKTNKVELINQFPLLCKAHIDNVVSAFGNGLYNVATLQMSTGNENSGRAIYNFNECYDMAKLAKAQGVGTYLPDQTSDGDNASHGPSHNVDSCAFQGQTRWHGSMMAYALEKLKDTGLLDSTLVVLFSEEGDHNHDLRYGGVVVAGGTGGGLSLGRVIDCGSSGGNGTHKLFGDIAKLVGAPMTEGPWKSGIIT